jgi:hypothetical protein
MTALLPSVPDVVWRQLRPRLWVGRSDGEHLGTIERGRSFTATDLAGEMRGGYRDLRAAQAALTGEIAVIAPQQARDRPAARPTLLIATTLAMLASVTLSTIGLAILR